MTEENRNGRTETMADVNHVHPHADRGAMTQLFGRGQVATDGGDDESETEAMADVQHTAPRGAGDSTSVFERGHEYRVQYR
ncbi:hypothetical protein A4G99_21490 [Haladaptatus sp. R4]|uniref:hypothetical protein n=1 Tax=Haladaptatus sp. R4 TaxID=1679489 RepID=UPI0007B4E09E|nr:hypothetical protein [Haladaptatus sp. R4]KZN26375.1 hypothetical protein A4G99_21490 [Haladaptatus sp. R4]